VVGNGVTVLRGERLVLRPAVDADVDALAAIVAEPEVGRWWGDYDAERIRRDHLEDTRSETFAVEVDGRIGGLVLVAEEEDPDYRHAALDIGLATAFQGRGLGREALRVVIDHLVTARGHHRFTIDPDVDNERAIRCYRAVGFKPVGVMRQYSRAVRGEWRDGLLMDLLAEERR